MEERDWELLQTLFKYKNITKAAQELFISQPTISKRLREIEQHFGVTIVQRGRRGVQFTPEGEYLAKSAEQMLRHLRKIREHVKDMNTAVVEGTLRLGVSNYFAKYQLPRVLKRFKDEYPHVEFQVQTGWSREVFQWVYNQDVHIGFVRGDYQWAGKKHLLFEETLCVAYREEFDLGDLPRFPRIDYRTESLFKGIIDNWWAEHFEQPPYVGMTVDRVDTCKEMVIHGLGYAIVPRRILHDAPHLYKLDLTDREGTPILRKTWMIYHEEVLALKIVKLFVDLVEHLDDW